jgi:hypothetical protein
MLQDEATRPRVAAVHIGPSSGEESDLGRQTAAIARERGTAVK